MPDVVLGNVCVVGSCWQLDGTTGRFHLPHARGSCQLLNPSRGLHRLTVDEQALDAAELLSINLPAITRTDTASNLEAYVRGNDLVAIYAPTDQHPFRSQAYWRLGSHPTMLNEQSALSAIELMASQQTDLLDSWPAISVASTLPASQVLRLDNSGTEFQPLDLQSGTAQIDRPDGIGCLLLRLPGEQLSYAEMVFPLDFEGSSITMTADRLLVRIEHRLFTQQLEKGVILRGRVLGLWLRREDDVKVAAAHYAAFASSDPPLTT